MPEYVESTEYIEQPVEEVVEYVEAVPGTGHESLAELAAEGPMSWPDDGSRAKHQGYIDDDPEEQMRHNPPVVERHHGKDGILDDDISLGIANEMGQRSAGMI